MHVRKLNFCHLVYVAMPIMIACAIAMRLNSVAAEESTKPLHSPDGHQLQFVGKSSGQVEEFAKQDVTVQVDGIVSRILFKPGQFVRKGDLLVELDDSMQAYEVESAKASVMHAQSQLAQARDDVELYEQLARKDVASRVKLRNAKITFEMANADLLAAKASLGKAELRLKWHKIYAPIDGRIMRAQVHEGAAVEAKFGKARITTINQVDPILVRYAIPYDRIAKSLRQGLSQKDIIGHLTFRLILPDGAEYGSLGKSIANSFEFDAKARLFFAFAQFANQQGLLQPGLNVTVEVWSNQR